MKQPHSATRHGLSDMRGTRTSQSAQERHNEKEARMATAGQSTPRSRGNFKHNIVQDEMGLSEIQYPPNPVVNHHFPI